MCKAMSIELSNAEEGPSTSLQAADSTTPDWSIMDCEIIVMERSNLRYAEYIESHLKLRGLNVDLMFPNDTASKADLFSWITSHGCKCALIIEPMHQEYQSVSVCVLVEDTAEEHRNVPIMHAVDMVTKLARPEEYAQGQFEIELVKDNHPESIKLLVNSLQQKTPITLVDIDIMIMYLYKKRELSFRNETGYGEEDDIDFDAEDEIFASERKIYEISEKEKEKKKAAEEARLAREMESDAMDFETSGNESMQNAEIEELLENEPLRNAIDDVMSSGILSNLEGILNQ